MALQKRDPLDDPRAALGEALRQLRLGCELTQAETGRQVRGYSEDSVQKAETGMQVPVDDLYGELVRVYAVTPREKVILDVMLANARKARAKVPTFFELYAANELKATFLRMWALDLIPGPLQLLEFAKAMYLMVGYDEAEAAEQAALRFRRHAKVDGPDAAQVTALLYEPVLHRLVGSPQLMVAELEHLLELSNRRNVVIQVVPDAGYFRGCMGQFDIASGPAIPDTVDMITVVDHVTEDPSVVGTALAVWEEIRGHALTVAQSRQVITEAIERWKSQQH